MTVRSRPLRMERCLLASVLALLALVPRSVETLSILAFDDFNRADGAIGSNWTTVTGESLLAIVSNKASSTASSNRSMWFNAATFPDDQYAQAKLYATSSGSEANHTGPGVACRIASGARTLYRLTATKKSTNNVGISKHVGGVFTGIQLITQAWTDGDTFRLECEGTTLRAYLNGTQIGTDATDSDITSGAAGLSFSSSITSFAMDDWEGGRLGSATAQGSQVFTTSDTWSWPAGVTSVNAEAIGGGGGGGAAAGNPSTGGGGKAGGYAIKAITKGAESNLTITVGAGGGGGVSTANGSNGGPSEVVQNGSTVLRASGGGGGTAGTSNSSNGAGSSTANGTAVGDTTRTGGNGGTGNFTSGVQGSGAGGGSAGATGAGGNASVNVGGTAGTGAFLDGNTYSSAGANGVGNSTDGATVTEPPYGAGGSGGKANNNTNRDGGAGADGVVVLTWSVTPKHGPLLGGQRNLRMIPVP